MTFLNFDSFARTDLSFWQKVKVTFSQKVDFDASLLVMKFYCQLLIRYHVTRAEAETCYGCLRVGIKKYKKEVCLLRRSGKIQDRRRIYRNHPLSCSLYDYIDLVNCTG